MRETMPLGIMGAQLGPIFNPSMLKCSVMLEGFKGGPKFDVNDAERRQPLGQLCA